MISGLVLSASFQALATIGVEFHRVPSISRIMLSGFIGLIPFSLHDNHIVSYFMGNRRENQGVVVK